MEENNGSTAHVEEDNSTSIASTNKDHGWQKVTYAKRQKKQQHPAKPSDSGKFVTNGSAGDGVFLSLEKHSEERRRKIEAQKAAFAAAYEPAPVRSSKHRSDDEDDSDVEYAGGVAAQNGIVDVKKVKPKKEKKPKVTVAEAAGKMDAADLAAFLADVTNSFEAQQDIQMMRFADYFGRAFSAVPASQFPWVKLYRESTIAKIADVPISHIPEAVYKTSADWINQRSSDALGSFVLWSLDSLLPDLIIQQAGAKGSKKVVQQAPTKSKVAFFVVLAMVLRRKPDVLVSIFPTLREQSKYQGQDKLPLTVWMIAQAGQGDLAVGLYLWSHLILPILGGKLGSNPQSRDLVLQLVERILSAPKARTILVNGAVRKGERLMPPSSLDLLLRVTFPSSSARVKATERFEAVYPTLKEVALAGSPGSKAMKQMSQLLMTYIVKAAGEGIPELSREAANIFIWCLTQNPDCCKQWDMVYMDNLDASVSILKKLTIEWKELSGKQSSLQALSEALKSFRQKNEKALAEGGGGSSHALFQEADKYCKVILGRLSRGSSCMKSLAFIVIAFGVGAAVMSTNMESWDWNKLSVMFSTHQSF